MASSIKNITQLTEKTLEWVEDVAAGRIHVNQAKQVFNGIGKAIAAQKAKLEYHQMRKESPTLPFFK